MPSLALFEAHLQQEWINYRLDAPSCSASEFQIELPSSDVVITFKMQSLQVTLCGDGDIHAKFFVLASVGTRDGWEGTMHIVGG